MINIQKIKTHFPIFEKNPKLIYLDSAATSLKPREVIKKLVEYYGEYSANIHRGIYKISERATKEYEESREIVAEFIGANSQEEIVFTKNATESINILAHAFSREYLKEGDEIVLSIMEHHSNFVPWQQISLAKKIKLRIVDIKDDFTLKIENFSKLINKKTKILTLCHVSNVLGTINPIKEIIATAKRINPNIITIVDGAQSVPHFSLNVKELNIDFLAFSGHKMLGPTGVGVLWGKKDLLSGMMPMIFGGGMIKSVGVERTEYEEPPLRFEAGTPPIAEAIALKEAINFLKRVGMEEIKSHEDELTRYAISLLQNEFQKEIKIIGPKDLNKRSGVISFVFKNIHPHDLVEILDKEDICLRAGHHCAMPLHSRLKISATSRASFYFYNDKKDIEKFVRGLKVAKKILRL